MIYCEPWCGANCTKVQYDRAVLLAHHAAEVLGYGWKSSLSHNMGWYASAVSPCGRIKVSVHDYRGKISYTAFLGQAEEPGGRYAEHGSTAKAAVRKVMKVAVADLKSIGALIEGLPIV